MGAFEVMLSVQMCMTLLDLFFNTAAILLYGHNTILLTLYILQDTSIVLSLILLVITFSSTFVFQAGLITLLIAKFAWTIFLSVAYLAISIGLHVYSLRLRWDSNGTHIWDYWLGALFVLHKIGAAFYYGSLKRTALKLSDPRLRGDTAWLRALVRSS